MGELEGELIENDLLWSNQACGNQASDADLAIKIATDQTNIPIYGHLTLTITVTNNSSDAISDIKIAASLPDKTVFREAVTFSHGSYDQFNEQHWNLDILEVNETASLTMKLLTIENGDIIGVASLISSNPQDINAENNTATIVVNRQGSNMGNNTISLAGLYPNPAKESITARVFSDINFSGTAYIIDISGSIAKRKEIRLVEGFNRLNFDVSNLSSGLYFMKVENSAIVHRFVKQ